MHADSETLLVVVRKELGELFAYVVWKVPDALNIKSAMDSIDIKCGQVATHEGVIVAAPQDFVLAARTKRNQNTIVYHKIGNRLRV